MAAQSNLKLFLKFDVKMHRFNGAVLESCRCICFLQYRCTCSILISNPSREDV